MPANEVKLIAHFKSRDARKNLWAVASPDKTVKVLNFGAGGTKLRKQPRRGPVVKPMPDLSFAEWDEMKSEAERLFDEAPAGFEIESMESTGIKEGGDDSDDEEEEEGPQE